MRTFMPNLSLAPCSLELGDLDGPARYGTQALAVVYTIFVFVT